MLALAIVAGACGSGASHKADDIALPSPPEPSATTDDGRADETLGDQVAAGSELVASTATGDCSATQGAVPAGAVSRSVADIDGDGSDDIAWLNVEGPVSTVGVITSSGIVDRIDLTAPRGAEHSVLVTLATEAPPAQLFVSDGQLVSVYVLLDCRIQAVRNREGVVYQFSLGATEFGTGVGCATFDRQRHLVGVNVVARDDTTVTWERTIVLLEGATATNGAVDQGTFTIGEDDDAIALLYTVACGTDVIDTFGLTATG